MDHPECLNCGYNLTGLRKAGVCPECGKAFDTRASSHHRLLDTARSYRRRSRLWASVAAGIVLLGALITLLDGVSPATLVFMLIFAGVSGLGAVAYRLAARRVGASGSGGL